jgi:acyl-CoA synthetase (AMP-forming)/AMP-acid ligase II
MRAREEPVTPRETISTLPRDDAPSTLLTLIGRADEAVALVDPGSGDAVTYTELHDVVARLARELSGRGVEPGDAVALSLANGPEIVLAFLAIVAAGAAAAPLNPAYKSDEFRAYLEDLSPRAMLFHGNTAEPARGVCSELGIATLDLPRTAARELSLGGRPGSLPAGDADAVALLLHTSGTTSRPKVVPLRQRNLAHSTRTIAANYALGPDDVSLCVMPLFHVHGLLGSTLATLHSGGTVVARSRFSPRAFWDDAVRQRAAWYSAVPTIHQMLVARAEVEPPPEHALRFARSCSAPLLPALQAAVEGAFGIPLLQAYGMTEASHQMCSNPLPPGERRPGSVGPATGVEAAVLDDDWRPLPLGETGEVAVRGRSVIDGYRDNPEANEASFRDAWFRTGDSGAMSVDGYVSLDGRIKELVNRGGEKISPHEVEAALLTHPAVSEAVAYAKPDARYGEQVAAAVVLKREASEKELMRHCAGRLAAFKVPESIAVLDAIPKGPTGKVQRRLLAEQIGR